MRMPILKINKAAIGQILKLTLAIATTIILPTTGIAGGQGNDGISTATIQAPPSAPNIAPPISAPPQTGAPEPTSGPQNTGNNTGARTQEGYFREVPRTQFEDQAGTSNGIRQMELAQRQLDQGASVYDPGVNNGLRSGANQAAQNWANYQGRWKEKDVQLSQALKDTIINTMRAKLMERGVENTPNEAGAAERNFVGSPTVFQGRNTASNFSDQNQIEPQPVNQPELSALLPPITANTAFSNPLGRELASISSPNEIVANSPSTQQISNLPLAGENPTIQGETKTLLTDSSPEVNVTVNNQEASKLVPKLTTAKPILLGKRASKDALDDLEQLEEEATEALAFLKDQEARDRSATRTPSSYSNTLSGSGAKLSGIQSATLAAPSNHLMGQGKVFLTDGPYGAPTPGNQKEINEASMVSTSPTSLMSTQWQPILTISILVFLFLCYCAFYRVHLLLDGIQKFTQLFHPGLKKTTPEDKGEHGSDVVVGSCKLDYWVARPPRRRSQKLAQSKPVLASGVKALTKSDR